MWFIILAIFAKFQRSRSARWRGILEGQRVSSRTTRQMTSKKASWATSLVNPPGLCCHNHHIFRLHCPTACYSFWHVRNIYFLQDNIKISCHFVYFPRLVQLSFTKTILVFLIKNTYLFVLFAHVKLNGRTNQTGYVSMKFIQRRFLLNTLTYRKVAFVFVNTCPRPDQFVGQIE